MKRNQNYLLRELADSIVLVPVGRAAMTFRGMITLNETGRFLWEQLEQEQTAESLTAAVGETYEIDAARAAADVVAFLEQLALVGALQQENKTTENFEGGTLK